MHDQGRHVDPCEVLAELGDQGWRGLTRRFGRGGGADVPAIPTTSAESAWLLRRGTALEPVRNAINTRVRALDGYVLYDNAAVLGLLRTSGRPLEVRWDGGDVLTIQLGVRPNPRPAHLARPG